MSVSVCPSRAAEFSVCKSRTCTLCIGSAFAMESPVHFAQPHHSTLLPSSSMKSESCSMNVSRDDFCNVAFGTSSWSLRVERGVGVKLRERQCTHTKSPHNEAAKWEHAPRYNENGAHRNRQKEAKTQPQPSKRSEHWVTHGTLFSDPSVLRPFLCYGRFSVET